MLLLQLGAYFSEDADGWQKNLNRIYSNLIDTVIANTIRTVKTRQNTKAVTIGNDLAAMAVEVCYQIYAAKSSCVGKDGDANVTQIVPLDVTQVQTSRKTRQSGHIKAYIFYILQS